MGTTFDRDRLREAFSRLGADLARRGAFIEIAVYGGIALMLQFEWRRSTEDVDAVAREGYDEAALAPSVTTVAEEMGLGRDWLNDAVGMFPPLVEDDALFTAAGTYPEAGPPGLRVHLAAPPYLLALKLQALASLDRGDRELEDARHLAGHLGFREVEDLRRLHRSVFDEEPAPAASGRFAAVLSG